MSARLKHKITAMRGGDHVAQQEHQRRDDASEPGRGPRLELGPGILHSPSDEHGHSQDTADHEQLPHHFVPGGPASPVRERRESRRWRRPRRRWRRRAGERASTDPSRRPCPPPAARRTKSGLPSRARRKRPGPRPGPAAPISWKAPGSEMNKAPMVLLPTSPTRSSAKITGKTMSPATNATEKSNSETRAASRLRLVFEGRYDP